MQYRIKMVNRGAEELATVPVVIPNQYYMYNHYPRIPDSETKLGSKFGMKRRRDIEEFAS